jgi:glucose-1-phosphate cytidylyltransferase
MKVVILAGGFGTRLSEYTDNIPKPMVPIGDIPIIHHIINIYARYGHKEYYIALGYKGDVIKSYFKNKIKDLNINLIDTGSETLTGGRVKRLEKYLKGETFLLTYGDGLSNININELITFHKSHKKIITMSVVRPPARFGALTLKDTKIVKFKEKVQLNDNWINGGFFVVNQEFFQYLNNDQTVLEKEPIENVVKDDQIRAFRHEGFWQCMDHKVDKDYLDKLVREKKAPWLI